ncbi:hypothetical protein QR685DRAFT_437668, partial [Neurospora intermedia]
FALIYINNKLVFLFRSKKDHLEKVYKVMEWLIIIKFYLNTKKYRFIIKSIKNFGFSIIISTGI